MEEKAKDLMRAIVDGKEVSEVLVMREEQEEEEEDIATVCN